MKHPREMPIDKFHKIAEGLGYKGLRKWDVKELRFTADGEVFVETYESHEHVVDDIEDWLSQGSN